MFKQNFLEKIEEIQKNHEWWESNLWEVEDPDTMDAEELQASENDFLTEEEENFDIEEYLEFIAQFTGMQPSEDVYMEGRNEGIDAECYYIFTEDGKETKVTVTVHSYVSEDQVYDSSEGCKNFIRYTWISDVEEEEITEEDED